MKQEGGGGTTALPGSVTASGRRGGGGGGGDFPRLLWDESVNGRGGGMHARWRGRAFTRRRRAPARHPRSVHHPDTHAAVGQRCTANQIKGGACVTSGGGSGVHDLNTLSGGKQIKREKLPCPSSEKV